MQAVFFTIVASAAAVVLPVLDYVAVRLQLGCLIKSSGLAYVLQVLASEHECLMPISKSPRLESKLASKKSGFCLQIWSHETRWAIEIWVHWGIVVTAGLLVRPSHSLQLCSLSSQSHARCNHCQLSLCVPRVGSVCQRQPSVCNRCTNGTKDLLASID